jgi:hypothetical protein
MQIKIVRHHRRPEDAEREIEHVGISDDFGRGRKPADHSSPIRVRHRDLYCETNRDDAE